MGCRAQNMYLSDINKSNKVYFTYQYKYEAVN